jgi:hypothetical protein
MKASKRDLVGRKIVSIDFHGFAPRPDRDKRKTATDPRIVLDSGRVLWFVVDETEVGEYGVAICISERAPKRKKELEHGSAR